jgi:hypothetical protein
VISLVKVLLHIRSNDIPGGDQESIHNHGCRGKCRRGCYGDATVQLTVPLFLMVLKHAIASNHCPAFFSLNIGTSFATPPVVSGVIALKLVSEELNPSSRRDETTEFRVQHAGIKWELMTVRNWGESPVGNWVASLYYRREAR